MDHKNDTPGKLTRRQLLAGGAALLGGLFSHWTWSQPGKPALPIPALVDGTRETPIDLNIQSGTWEFVPGVDTPTTKHTQHKIGRAHV